MADLSPALAAQLAVIPKSSPYFAYDDGEWNHGEGFGPTHDADYGGWHGPDDGTDLVLTDIHVDPAATWVLFQWADDLYFTGTHPLLRLEGYLGPDDYGDLPQVHPLYGMLPPTAGPIGNGRYVDQGAFEMFRPVTGPLPTDKILVIIRTWSTTGFPFDAQRESLRWRQVYPGFFSPDGLKRSEHPTGGPTGFLNNDDDSAAAVNRPSLNLLRSWETEMITGYWPILAYQPSPKSEKAISRSRGTGL
jgi:hypothetical protein